LLKIEELIKPLNKGPKVWSDHLAKVGTFEFVMVSDCLPFFFRCCTVHVALIISLIFQLTHTIYALKKH
jgi:hypothetical protein